MSSIITGILRSTVGLLYDKARDSAANKLKDGDLSDEKLREIIVRDLTDIKSKLDCLSLKDLDASCSFLREGVKLFNLALDESNEDRKASEGPTNEATTVMNDTASGILNATLSLPQATQRLKVSSDKRFVDAQDCFKASREAATHAFNNKSLSIKDRIMACKLRMTARILESGLEDPEAATTACLSPLEELHALPEIQKMFAVFLKGGVKSEYKKAERLENIMSVLCVNHVLYDFASKYISKSANPFTWPEIQLKDRTFHPILHARELVTETSSSEEFVQQLNRVVVLTDPIKYRAFFAVNSRGEIILLKNDKIMVISSTDKSKVVEFPQSSETIVEHWGIDVAVDSTGESKDVKLPQSSEAIVEQCGIDVAVDSTGGSKDVKLPQSPKTIIEQQWGIDVAVDSNDNVYAVRRLKTRDKNGSDKKDFFKLYVFDENYNIKHESAVLGFLEAMDARYVMIALDRNQNLIMLAYWNDQVYICDNTGKLKFQFKLDGDSGSGNLSISNNNDIMIVSHDHNAVQIYSTQGKLKSTIKVPEGYKVQEVAFHHGICNIIVLTNVKEQSSCFLLGYSETGDLENKVFFCKYGEPMFMKSRPSGSVAVRVFDIITLI